MNGTSDPSCPRSADFQYLMFTVVYSVVFILGFPGNVAALYVFFRKVKRTTPSHMFFINLAVVDILFLCTLPFRIHYHFTENNWIFGDIACRITGTLYFANICISTAFMTCICVDRYIAVVHPLKYLKLKNTHYSAVITMLVWAVAVATMVPLIVEAPLTKVYESNITACFENFSDEEWNQLAAYNIFAIVSGFVIPFAIITICYPLIAKRITQIRHNYHKRKALRIIYLILAVSVLCFVPYHVVHVVYLLIKLNFIKCCVFHRLLYKIRRVTMALVSFNSCIDPVLYYFSTSNYKYNFRFKLFKTKRVYTIYDIDMDACINNYNKTPCE
ncbi:lysophosphatidic acid receptor 6 [Latimeria chalumnae]|uniref:G-protein coupled receptors family 1 profile domain-containing protein n=1 Tax=Latimeria chalumnae TaxID=7897 RepID=H3BHM7_LATCH|nr:PREDICTED: lysophosphatidic acid receptor 6-like [Latimeria chalumnae]|eukprot:XP_014343801.1 PREDICTED: lysophosphatidic acid receptor 6-like [Latimeria chalumnae]